MPLRGGLLGSGRQCPRCRSFALLSLPEGDEQCETMQARAVQLPKCLREREFRIGGTLGARDGGGAPQQIIGSTDRVSGSVGPGDNLSSHAARLRAKRSRLTS